MDENEKNPFCKKFFNLTRQMELTRADPEKAAQLQAEAHFIDAEHERLKRQRNLIEFNKLTAAEKVQFIRGGGEVIA